MIDSVGPEETGMKIAIGSDERTHLTDDVIEQKYWKC